VGRRGHIRLDHKCVAQPQIDDSPARATPAPPGLEMRAPTAQDAKHRNEKRLKMRDGEAGHTAGGGLSHLFRIFSPLAD